MFHKKSLSKPKGTAGKIIVDLLGKIFKYRSHLIISDFEAKLMLTTTKRNACYMHLIIAVWSIFAAWRWGNWINWKQYHATMLYMPLMNLLYLFFCSDYLLWIVKPDVGLSAAAVALVYTFIVFPCTVLIFLTNYPETLKKQAIHILKWVIIYAGIEWIGGLIGRITYQHGWSLGSSVLFVLIMFPMLALHHRKPAAAYVLSTLIIIILLFFFNVPWTHPLEE